MKLACKNKLRMKSRSFLTIYPAPIMTPIKKLGTREAIIIMELSTAAMELIRSRQMYA